MQDAVKIKACPSCMGFGTERVVHHPGSLGPHAKVGVVGTIPCRQCYGSGSAVQTYPCPYRPTTDRLVF